MSLKKFGQGEVVGTEGKEAKTASKAEWTEADEAALEEENQS